ncbi:MAG: DUF4292 domain-containing protein [Bacteroidota bacterium]
MRILFLGLFGILVLSSCGTSKKTIDRVGSASLEEVLTGMKSNQRNYNWFSAKGKIKVNGQESSLGGRTNIRMVRDSVIFMNFKKLSIEAARTLLTADSCFVLYRFDNLYESGPLKEFTDYYKVYLTFRELQDVIVGQFPIPAAAEVDTFRSAEYHIVNYRRGSIEYTYELDDKKLLRAVSIRDESGRNARAVLSDYDEDGFAAKKELFVDTPETGKSRISIKLSSVVFDVPKKIAFEIPSHYVRI